MLGRDSSGCQDILRELPPCWGAGPREPAREPCLGSGAGRETRCRA